MKCLVLFAAVAVVTLEGADVAAAAELPAYESMASRSCSRGHVRPHSDSSRHARLSSSDRGPDGAQEHCREVGRKTDHWGRHWFTP